MKRILVALLTLAMILPIGANAQTANRSDISLTSAMPDSHTENFMVGEVMVIHMASNFVTTVSATVKSKSGSKVISPVWGDKSTDTSGNWIGYLLPFSKDQIGDWVLEVKTTAETLTKEFNVYDSVYPTTFSFSASSQFEQVGGVAGKFFITNAPAGKEVNVNYGFYPKDESDHSGGGYFSDPIGVTDSQGKLEFQAVGSQPTRTPKDVGVYVVEAEIDGATRDVVVEVSDNPAVSSITHAPGSNIVDSNGTVYFIDGDYIKIAYTSAGAFSSYKFNSWSGVSPESESDKVLIKRSDYPTDGYSFIPPREGALINDKGTVYIITEQGRAGFTTSKVFTDLGYSFKYVYPGDTSFMRTLPPINTSDRVHPVGTIINQDGTLFLISDCYNGDCKKSAFPSMAIYDSWGYWIEEAVKANASDRAVGQSPQVLESRPNTRLTVSGVY